MNEIIVRFDVDEEITSHVLRTLLVKAIYEKNLDALDILGQIVHGL